MNKRDFLGASAVDPEVEAYFRNSKRLYRALGLPIDSEIDLHPIGSGEHNLNFLFNDPASGSRYVLRVNVTRQPFHKNQVLYEFDALKSLEPSGCTPVPLFVDDSMDAPYEGVLVESFCEGRQLDFDDLHPGDLGKAAALMARVHSVVPKRDCRLIRPEDPLHRLLDECVARYRLYTDSPYCEDRIRRYMDRAILRIEGESDCYEFEPADARIVNNEPLSSHFLLFENRIQAESASENKIADADSNGTHIETPGYFIDWERPMLGDIAEDLAFFTDATSSFWESDHLFPSDRIQMVLTAYWQAMEKTADVVDMRGGGASAASSDEARGLNRLKKDFEKRFLLFRKATTLRALCWCCRAEVQFREMPELYRTKRAESKVPVYLSEDFLTFLWDDVFSERI